MKIFLIFVINLAIASFLSAEDSKIDYDKINISKIDEVESEELQKVEQKIDFNSIGFDKATLIVKNTSGFDFENYVIENERKKIGYVLWNGDLNKITDTNFKERILKAKEQNIAFKKKYLKINTMRSIRLKAITYISANRSLLNNEEAFYANLLPNEIALFKECGSKKALNTKDYSSAYSIYYRNKKQAFKIKYDLVLQSEINDKKFTCKEILNLMIESEYYLENFNLGLLNKTIVENDTKNTWDDLLLSLKLWKDFKSYEKSLFEDCFVQDKLNELVVVVLGIISNKDYAEKKEELEKILGAKLFQSIFIEKLDLSKIPELNFDNETLLLRGGTSK